MRTKVSSGRRNALQPRVVTIKGKRVVVSIPIKIVVLNGTREPRVIRY